MNETLLKEKEEELKRKEILLECYTTISLTINATLGRITTNLCKDINNIKKVIKEINNGI